MVDFYKNDSFNVTVVAEEEIICIIDGNDTNNITMLIADYNFQVEEEGKGSGVNWFLGEVEAHEDGVGKLWHPSLKGGSTPNVQHHGN